MSGFSFFFSDSVNMNEPTQIGPFLGLWALLGIIDEGIPTRAPAMIIFVDFEAIDGWLLHDGAFDFLEEVSLISLHLGDVVVSTLNDLVYRFF